MDITMLPGFNDIGTTQTKPTTKTKSECQQIMDYAATYPDIFIRYYANDMILHVDSDAAYLVAPKAKSRTSGYFYLSNNPCCTQTPSLNGAILVECKIL